MCGKDAVDGKACVEYALGKIAMASRSAATLFTLLRLKKFLMGKKGIVGEVFEFIKTN